MTKKMTNAKTKAKTKTKMKKISWKAVSAPVQRESLGSHKETAPALPGLSENWRGRCCLLVMRRRWRMRGMLLPHICHFMHPLTLVSKTSTGSGVLISSRCTCLHREHEIVAYFDYLSRNYALVGVLFRGLNSTVPVLVLLTNVIGVLDDTFTTYPYQTT